MVDLRLAKFSYDKWITSAKHDDPLPGLLCSTDFIIKWQGRSSLFRSSGSWGFLQNCAPRYRGNSYVNSYAGPKCMLSSSFQPNLFGRTFPTILKWADKDTKETSLPLIFLANFQAFLSPSTRLILVTWSWVKDKQNWRFMEQPGTGLACPHDTCVLDPGLNMKHSILRLQPYLQRYVESLTGYAAGKFHCIVLLLWQAVQLFHSPFSWTTNSLLSTNPMLEIVPIKAISLYSRNMLSRSYKMWVAGSMKKS